MGSRLREEQDDIEAWLSLIDLQDGLLKHRRDDESSKLFTEQAIHDKKLAIVERALDKNPSNMTLMVIDAHLVSSLLLLIYTL